MADHSVTPAQRHDIRLRVPKIAMAFMTGLVGALSAAVFYSNWQQSRVLTQIGSQPDENTRPISRNASSGSTASGVWDQNLPLILDREWAFRPAQRDKTAAGGPPMRRQRTPVVANQTSPATARAVEPAAPQSQSTAGQDQGATVTAVETPAHAAEPSAPEAPKLVVPTGTPVAVRLSETLAAGDARAGDAFRASLEAPVVIDGVIVAKPGSPVLGVVVNARKPHLFGKSELKLRLTRITAADGRLIPIATGMVEQQGHGSKLARGLRGVGTEMPEGMPLTFTLTAPVTVLAR